MKYLPSLHANAHVADSNPHESVGIAGDGNHCLDFGNVGADVGDGIDAGIAGKAEFGERLQRAALVDER